MAHREKFINNSPSRRKVGNQRLVNACKQAKLFGVYNYPIILQIIEKNLGDFSEEKSPYRPRLQPILCVAGEDAGFMHLLMRELE